jgi:hypothetical protein
MIKLPASMDSSYCPVTDNYFILKQLPCCEQLAPDLNEKVFIDMANALGAGSVISTANDLIKWGKYLFKQAPKIVVETMLKNYGTDSDSDIINLGLGTQHTKYLGDLIGHQGVLDSYSSFFGYAPKNDTLIITLSNNIIDSNKLMEGLNSFVSEPEEVAFPNTENMHRYLYLVILQINFQILILIAHKLFLSPVKEAPFA